MNYDLLNKEIDDELETKKIWIGTPIWIDHKKTALLAKSALTELKNLREKCSSEQFLSLIHSATLVNNGNFCLNGILNDKDINSEYCQKLAEFNRNFFLEKLEKFDSTELIRFLISSLSHGWIAPEFIDAMKFHPDAPSEYRDSLKKGDWNTENTENGENTENTTNTKDTEKNIKRWDEINLEEETAEHLYEVAKDLFYHENVSGAINIFSRMNIKTIKDQDLAIAHILLEMSHNNPIAAKMARNKYNEILPQGHPIDNLITSFETYDTAWSLEECKNFKTEDPFILDLLLKIKKILSIWF